MDVDQHTRQTEGWQSSWEHLKTALDAGGPFDGIMGFSQVQKSPIIMHYHVKRTCSSPKVPTDFDSLIAQDLVVSVCHT